MTTTDQVGGGAGRFRATLGVRYYEHDQQGVLFNMWYLGYFEEGRNRLLESIGYSLTDLLDDGYDIQLVHTEIDFQRPIRYRDAVEIEVAPVSIGNTSFVAEFALFADGQPAAIGRTVYVIVDGSDWDKRSLPGRLRTALRAERERLNAVSAI